MNRAFTRFPGKMLPYALGFLFKKPATVQYPRVKTGKPENFRGKLAFDSGKCIGCRICVRICPSGAISIEKQAEKTFRAFVRLDRCIYCGQCVDSCLKHALKYTCEFELACLNKQDLNVEI